MATVVLPDSLAAKLRQLREVREEQDGVVKKINKFHARLNETSECKRHSVCAILSFRQCK